MKKIVGALFAAFCICAASAIFAQQRAGRYAEIYYQMSMIDGEYIPADVYDAIRTLDSIFTAKEKRLLRRGDIGFESELELEMWIRNGWGLWRHSRLAHYLAQTGKADYLGDADGMSSYLTSAYLKHLRGEKYIDDNTERGVPGKSPWSHFVTSESKLKKGIIDNSNIRKILDNYKYMRENELYVYCDGDKVPVRCTYSNGCTSAQQDSIKKIEELDRSEYEAVITAINIADKTMKVRIVNCHSPHGIIIMDGRDSTRRAADTSPDFQALEKQGCVYIMKKGEEMWFPADTGLWRRN